MIAIEVVGTVLIVALMAVTAWMAIVGLMGIGGVALRLERCPTCGHLIPTPSTAVADCPYCRHQRLLHPHLSHLRIHSHHP